MTPTYDANGNLTDDGLRTYTWDGLDQLSQVSGGDIGIAVNYSYDDSGRRIAKAIAGTQTLWTYDGQDIYAEYTDKWTTPSAVYTSGGAIDDPVIKATITATGTGPGSYGPALYYHADGLGTVVGLSNSQDSSTQLTVVDAWGVSLGGQSTPGAQYGYTGREPDEAGLVYMRARYYSPQFGRFVSRDPAGLQGGINAYAYCGNNPTNCTDPSGMLPQSPLGSFVDSSYFGMGSQGVDSSYVTTAGRVVLERAQHFVVAAEHRHGGAVAQRVVGVSPVHRECATGADRCQPLELVVAVGLGQAGAIKDFRQAGPLAHAVVGVVVLAQDVAGRVPVHHLAQAVVFVVGKPR